MRLRTFSALFLKREPFLKFVCLVMVLSLVAFPKGGIKLSGIPFTWGYLFLLSFGFSLLALHLINYRHSSYTGPELLTLLAWFSFFIYSSLSLAFLGYQDSLGMLLSFILSFYFIPYFFHIAFKRYILAQLPLLVFYLKRSIFFVAAYGVFLFFFRTFFGFFIEIPLVTVNYADWGNLDYGKHIARFGFFKLIATYNNGNLYGVCLLMLLPLYYHLERSFSKLAVIRLSLLLTLSRAVWVTWILHEVLSSLFLLKKKKNSFFQQALLLLGSFASIALVLVFLDSGIAFLLDKSLSGRRLDHLEEINLFSTYAFNGIHEMTYVSIMHTFGFFGLLLFFLALSLPLIFFLFRKVPNYNSKFKCALAIGTLNYLFIALVDGATLLIPTMVFFLFLQVALSNAVKKGVFGAHSRK